MKKNEFIYPAVFLAIVFLLFTIPIGAFLTSEVLGFETARSDWKWVYQFLKDQGGFIGSIFGTLVLAITVYLTLKKQSENTQKQIDFEIKKNRVNACVQEMEKCIVALERIKAAVSRIYASQASQDDGVAVFIVESEVTNDITLVLLIAELEGLCGISEIERIHSNAKIYFIILRVVEMKYKQLPFSLIFEVLFQLSRVERREVFHGDSEMALADLVNSIKDFTAYAGEDHLFEDAQNRLDAVKKKLDIIYDKLPDAITCLKNDIVRNIEDLSRDIYVKKNKLLSELN